MPSLRDGAFPGLTSLDQVVCRDCGHKAVPFEFDEEADWKAFHESVRSA